VLRCANSRSDTCAHSSQNKGVAQTVVVFRGFDAGNVLLRNTLFTVLAAGDFLIVVVERSGLEKLEKFLSS
jgi:hypothetical protein